MEIVVSLQSQIRNLDFCNNLKFSFSVLPHEPFMDAADFSSLLSLNSTSLTNPTFAYSPSKLDLSYDFTNDMVLLSLEVTYNATLMLQYPNYTFIFTPSAFTVDPQNNVPANFLNE